MWHISFDVWLGFLWVMYAGRVGPGTEPAEPRLPLGVGAVSRHFVGVETPLREDYCHLAVTVGNFSFFVLSLFSFKQILISSSFSVTFHGCVTILKLYLEIISLPNNMSTLM